MAKSDGLTVIDYDDCPCKKNMGESPSLDILKHLNKLYENRLKSVMESGSVDKLTIQNNILKDWVRDLEQQNNLLVKTVEELEVEAIKRIKGYEHKITCEQQKYLEIETELRAELSILKRKLERKDSDLRGLIEVLRRLRELDSCRLDGIHFFEVTPSDIFGDKNQKLNEKIEESNNLRNLNEMYIKEVANKEKELRELKMIIQEKDETISELNNNFNNKPATIDVNTSVNLNDSECHDEMEPVKDKSASLIEQMNIYQNKIIEVETALKDSIENQRSLKRTNVEITDEVNTLRKLCLTLEEHCRKYRDKELLKDDIIKEMRNQLRKAKHKLNEESSFINNLKKNHSERKYEICGDCVYTNSLPRPVNRKYNSSGLERGDEKQPDITWDNNFVTSTPNQTAEAPRPVTANVKKPCKNCSQQKVCQLYFNKDMMQESPSSFNNGGKSNGPKPVRKDATFDIPNDSEQRDKTYKLCAAAERCVMEHLHYCEEKLNATLQILKNKDEMLKIQEDSLKIAEVRVQTVAEHNEELQSKLDAKIREVEKLQKLVDDQRERASPPPPPPPMRDCVKNTINNLHSDLTVIQKLYRNCFYESVKQEEMIELLKDALAEMKSKDIEKSSEIERLARMLSNQRWDTDDCQDLICEVENLKVEVNNALDSLSSDSSECTCGLKKDNFMLKKLNENLQNQISELNERNDTMQKELLEKDTEIKSQQELMNSKDSEIQTLNNRIKESIAHCNEYRRREMEQLDELEKIRNAMSCLEIDFRDSKQELELNKNQYDSAQKTVEGLKIKLMESKSLLRAKAAEYDSLKTTCEFDEKTITHLKEELDKMRGVAEEKTQIKCVVSQLKIRIQQLEADLLTSENRFRELEQSYQDKEHSAMLLERELAEASTRGEVLCSESKHIVCGVRQWMDSMKERDREKSMKISALRKENYKLKAKLKEYGSSSSIECSYSKEGQSYQGFSNGMSEDVRLHDLCRSSDESRTISPRMNRGHNCTSRINRFICGNHKDESQRQNKSRLCHCKDMLGGRRTSMSDEIELDYEESKQSNRLCGKLIKPMKLLRKH